jgi:hypothetical protein
LSEEDSAWISFFIAAQKCRSTNFRAVAKDFDEKLVGAIRDMGGNPNNVGGYRPFADDEDVKRFSLKFLFRMALSFAEALVEKEWFLLRTTDTTPFWIGDNPVAMYNGTDFYPRGNIGLHVRGIQIYLPLSSTLTLALWCPSLLEAVQNALKKAHNAIERVPAEMLLLQNPNIDDIDHRVRSAEKFIDAATLIQNAACDGYPLECTSDNVDFHNSLQVLHAERYVMSRDGQFDIAKSMTDKAEKIRKGPRFAIA